MWGCNFYSNVPGMGYFLSRSIFPFLFLGLIFLLIIFIIIKSMKTSEGVKNLIVNDKHDSMAILKIRYAKGEINNEEFHKMKQVLS